MTDKEGNFLSAFNKIAEEIYQISRDKGFHDKERNEGEVIALCHSELSEGLEALRLDKMSNKIPDFSGIEEELADTIIRIMDWAHSKKYRVAEALIEKIKFNKNREYMHGGKNF